MTEFKKWFNNQIKQGKRVWLDEVRLRACIEKALRREFSRYTNGFFTAMADEIIKLYKEKQTIECDNCDDRGFWHAGHYSMETFICTKCKAGKKWKTPRNIKNHDKESTKDNM